MKPGDVNEEAAVNLLNQHYHKIDTVKALQIIPLNTPVLKLKDFLSAVIGERASQRRDMQVMRSIHKSEQFQVINLEISTHFIGHAISKVREELLQYSDRRTTIDDDVFVALWYYRLFV